MPQAALSLGPISFQEFEIPPMIAFGGRHRIATHYLSSGARQIDTLGPDDANISFAGVLSGPNAAIRAHEIDTLRSIGTPLTLAWSEFEYLVIISEFRAEYRNRWWIPYRITCTIVSDPISASLTGNDLLLVDALASLNLIYDIAPGISAVVPDPRPPVSAAAASRGNAEALAAASAALAATASTLTASNLNCESQLNREISTYSNLTVNAPKYIAQLVDFAEHLQSFATALDCVGHASVCLQEINP